MTDKISYFAMVGPEHSVDQPIGLLRRLTHDDGPEDEGLRDDLSWRKTSLIVEHDNGSLDGELVEVSHEQAGRIVEYFRAKRAGEAGL